MAELAESEFNIIHEIAIPLAWGWVLRWITVALAKYRDVFLKVGPGAFQPRPIRRRHAFRQILAMEHLTHGFQSAGYVPPLLLQPADLKHCHPSLDLQPVERKPDWHILQTLQQVPPERASYQNHARPSRQGHRDEGKEQEANQDFI